MKRRLFALFLVITFQAGAVAAEPGLPAASLDDLLEQVRRGWKVEVQRYAEREAEFLARKSEQERLLAEARAQRTDREERSASLERRFEENEAKIAELEALLQSKMGGLGELFGVVRQVAGDTRGQFQTSLISAQMPGRQAFLDELAQSTALPEIEKLQHLWFLLQQEMTQSGKVVRFPATVVTGDGKREERAVTRAGAFNVFSGGKYLSWVPESGQLVEFPRQPASRDLDTVEEFEEQGPGGLAPLAVDPSRGAILSLLVQTPSRSERIEQGGPVGYLTIVLGLIGGLIGLARLVYVFFTGRKVRAQRASRAVQRDNPLGRILHVYEQNRQADVETLTLKLDEAILREAAGLDRFLWAIKVISVVAPLLGLLGTVTGMIQTFQVITLFGTGDPKLMASGISEALVTTMIGLCVAIPLVLLHSVISTMSRRVVQILEEQSAGLVATRMEEEKAHAAAA